MDTFFNGWRRKAGCMLLMLAGCIAIFWSRSYVVGDALSFWKLNVVSQEGQVSWAWFADVLKPSVHWGTVDLLSDLPSWDKMAYVHYDDSVHYGIVAVPLTLLSACLILWKPRPKP
jgi:hypothetical protein